MSELQPEVPQVFEINRREGDGLTVVLWWVHGTMDTFVQVEDVRGDDFMVQVPDGVAACEVFKHPFAYKAAEARHGRA